MKFYYLLPFVFISSCIIDDNVPKQTCGLESKSDFIIHNSSEFSASQNTLKAGDAEYISYYKYLTPDFFPPDEHILWGVQTKLNNICNADKPNIDFSIFLHNSDTSARVFCNIEDDPSNTISVLLPVSLNGTYYHNNLDFNLSNNVQGALTIYASVFIAFPRKGSYSADSAYFFSNLDSLSIKIIAQKPK